MKPTKLKKPMNRFLYQSIMDEYLIDPNECLENLNIQKAISMNDEVIQHRIDYTVQHSPYTISEKEYAEIEEYEYSLIHIEDLN